MTKAQTEAMHTCPLTAMRIAMRRAGEGWTDEQHTRAEWVGCHDDLPLVLVVADFGGDRIKIVACVDGRDKTTTFRPRKDGTFNVALIANRLKEAAL